jgi:hypothetical protein
MNGGALYTDWLGVQSIGLGKGRPFLLKVQETGGESVTLSVKLTDHE